MTNPIYVAIDTPHLGAAQSLAAAVASHVGGLKLGLEFFAANGPNGIRLLGEAGLPIFLDLKLHDIPNTVSKAVAALAPLRPAVLTVHAAGGRAMLEAAKAAAPAATKVVAVTMLTSLEEQDLVELGFQSDVTGNSWNFVTRLAQAARAAGLDGVVCSGHEVGGIRDLWPDAFCVVPGLRPAGAHAGDQKRVVTPTDALERGASILVIGRPITGAANPAAAAQDIAASLSAPPALPAGA